MPLCKVLVIAEPGVDEGVDDGVDEGIADGKGCSDGVGLA